MTDSLIPAGTLFQTEGPWLRTTYDDLTVFFVHGLKVVNFLYHNYGAPDSWKNNHENTQVIYVSCSGTQKLMPGS